MQQEGPQQLTQINSMKLDGFVHFASNKCCLKRYMTIMIMKVKVICLILLL